MFKKILIANRGEIACRIIRTAKAMGIATVAVHSDADKDALHVEMADEAVGIGPPPAAQSYLLIDRMVAAARETGAQAVHPGYGFLSENAGFARALEAAGIVFIGPPAKAIEAMGDKIESKKVAARAKVSTVPGHLGVIADAHEAVRVAGEIGYPVMIKASAGGGGKGMRIAASEAEVAQGFASSRSEAKSSFGDERVFIEKFIEDPRHIEIQVLADGQGNCIHLGERECSIQRRNQKVIEEAPSPFLDAATRAAMGGQAVALAKAVGYVSAGTVEFIVDREKRFYFLEMNTRLQVEHPVTELVTGLDLVALMIQIAAGERLPLTQDDVRLEGWAVEARIYAEDPARRFLPSTGRLVRYRPPQQGTVDGLTVRNDTGVGEGSEISIFYDPMIAKLVTHGPARAAAITHMTHALDRFVIDGIRHNIPFLAALMRHPRWRAGDLSTAFIADEYPNGFAPRPLDEDERDLFAAVAGAIDHLSNQRRRLISHQMAGNAVRFAERRVVMLGDDRREITVEGALGAPIIVSMQDVSGKTRTVRVESDWWFGDPLWTGRVDGVERAIQVRPIANGALFAMGGASVETRVYTPREAALAELMPAKTAGDARKVLRCPMPGLVLSIPVRPGQDVKAGETLAVVEAMKMENVLRAECDAVVAKVLAKPGDSLAVDAVILEFV